eukprot:TRINITY_DN23117_c0_g1_i1.p1 TRINITY_DN23117_c0_g1~~TRINITY_DN23117_c0_g1_i1.p1  ORF type:complete len:623 (-),score=74.39 TRINITY_DN23117_c0_g1_i1:969-2837(-)
MTFSSRRPCFVLALAFISAAFASQEEEEVCSSLSLLQTKAIVELEEGQVDRSLGFQGDAALQPQSQTIVPEPATHQGNLVIPPSVLPASEVKAGSTGTPQIDTSQETTSSPPADILTPAGGAPQDKQENHSVAADPTTVAVVKEKGLGPLDVPAPQTAQMRPGGVVVVKPEPPRPTLEPSSDAEGKSDAKLVITGICATIVLGLVAFALHSGEDKAVVRHAWLMTDMVVAIFLAVLWYKAVSAAITFMVQDPSSPFFGKAHLLHMLHAMVLLLVATVFSFWIRNHRVQLASFCGCAAHFASFASMGAAIGLQEHLVTQYSDLGVFLAIPTVAALLMLLYYLVKFFKLGTGMEGNDEWEDSISDVENDFFAMAIASVATLAVAYVISGEYRSMREMEGMNRENPMLRNGLLNYALVLLPVGALISASLSRVQAATANPFVQRNCAVASSVTTMLVAWGFLLAAQWEFASLRQQSQPILARLEFAILASFCGGVCLVGLVKLTSTGSSWFAEAEAATMKFALKALAIIVGFSWEEVLHQAIRSFADRDLWTELQLRVGLAVGLGVVIIPLYALYYKPAVLANTEDARQVPVRSESVKAVAGHPTPKPSPSESCFGCFTHSYAGD